MLVLIGIAVLVAGFALRLNPLLVVIAAALATGLATGIAPIALLAAFGKAFNQNRLVTLVYLVLPVVGLLERYGLQARASAVVRAMKGATVGRLLIAYLALRQILAALGLTAVAGPAQTVRPLLAPMATAAAEALLMASVLGADFARWFAAFLPDCARGEPATLFTPATVSDRSDGKIAHLDGLNLSRAWCWRRLARDLPDLASVAFPAADAHLAAALPHLATDYMGEHWLATFALLALTA